MRYKPTKQALVKTLDNGAVALHVDSGDYYSLNSTAIHMWTLMERGCTVVEIVATIADQYAVSAEDAKKDVSRFLHELEERGLIESA